MSKTAWDNDCYWAKLASYAPWPARKCSKREEDELIRLQPGRSADHIAMVFCGTKNERAWVLPNCIYEFDYGTFKMYFDAKKFKNDKDYRLGVIEGVRINREQGFSDTDVIQTMISAFKDMYPKQDDYDSGFCDECGGSIFSGSLQICPICKESGKTACRRVHDHCFMKNDPRGHLQLWVCDTCCKANHKKSGWTVPCKEETSRDNKSNSDDKKRHRKSASSNEKATTSAQNTSGDIPTTSSTDDIAVDIDNNKSSNLIKTVLDAVLQPNKKVVHPPLESTKLSIDDVDDHCFVCNEGGEVVLCDYPYCPKVYHQVCVAKLFPQPAHPSHTPAYEHPNSTTASSYLYGFGHEEKEERELDTSVEWYCPRHFCSDCGALQTVTNISLDTLPLPPILYETAMNARIKGEVRSGELIKEKKLKQCKTCPFAMCLECEDMLSEEFQTSFFYSPSSSSTAAADAGSSSSTSNPQQQQGNVVAARTRHSNTGSSSSSSNNYNSQRTSSAHHSLQSSAQQCTCCYCHEIHSIISTTDTPMDTVNSLGGKLKLAKCLEIAWMKMTTSRLALPFLRPMLPIPLLTSTTVDESEKTVDKNDLMDLLENIHSLKYNQITDFTSDLHSLLTDVINDMKPSQQQQQQGRSEDVLILAMKTIISTAESYLKGKKKDFELPLPSTSDESSLVKKQRRLSHEQKSLSSIVWWRMECHFHPLVHSHPLRSLLTFNSNNNINHQDTRIAFHSDHDKICLVLPRSLSAWRAFVKQGDDYGKRAAAWREVLLADDDDHADDNDDNDGDDVVNGNGHSSKMKRNRKHSGKGSNKDVKLSPHEEALETNRARQMIRRTLRDVLTAPLPGDRNQSKGISIGNVYHMSHKHDYYQGGDETAARVAADLDAARLMIGMKNSALRDTVTLPFPSSSAISTARFDAEEDGNNNGAMDVELLDPEHDSRLFHASMYDYHQTPIEDESLLIIQRLQEMSKQTLALQQQLKQEYLQRQRRVLDTGTEVIALGEVGIITELKLSNDLLRHALQQREGLLKSSQRQVAALQQTVSEQRQLLDQLQGAVSSSSSSHKRKRKVQLDDDEEEGN